MFAITYILRVVPLLIFKKQIKSVFIQSFLYYVPYAVLATLTFPSVFYSVGDIRVAAIATVVALILSFFKQKLIIVALAAVLVAFGFSFIFY